MNISVLFFASLRERYQREKMDLNVPEGTAVKDIFSIITDKTSSNVRVEVSDLPMSLKSASRGLLRS